MKVDLSTKFSVGQVLLTMSDNKIVPVRIIQVTIELYGDEKSHITHIIYDCQFAYDAIGTKCNRLDGQLFKNKRELLRSLVNEKVVDKHFID